MPTSHSVVEANAINHHGQNQNKNKENENENESIHKISCSVLIAGGSTAALAAALASASRNIDTCLTEPTDWLGGQLTSSAGLKGFCILFSYKLKSKFLFLILFSVSAIDFGKSNNPALHGWVNLPRSFRELLDVLHVDNRCWVSSICYRPTSLLPHIDALVKKLSSHLRVFRSTLVQSVVTTDISANTTVKVKSVRVVQRHAKHGMSLFLLLLL